MPLKCMDCRREIDYCPDCGGELRSIHQPQVDDDLTRCTDPKCGFSYRESDNIELPGPCDAADCSRPEAAHEAAA